MSHAERSTGLAVLEPAPRPARGPLRQHEEPASAALAPLAAPTGIYARHGKRCVDLLLVGSLALAGLVPALFVALVNLAIHRDPRKILFSHDRIGRDGKVFRLYKFRTMRDVPMSDLSSWASGTDHVRVTRFGRWLRNTHLDELPQLLNVLRGEMSVIGPRPEMTEVHAWATSEVPGFAHRLVVRPGITGLAQVTQGYTGMDADDYARKLAIDVRYVENLSLAFDLTIALRTAGWLVRRKGWYRG